MHDACVLAQPLILENRQQAVSRPQGSAYVLSQLANSVWATGLLKDGAKG